MVSSKVLYDRLCETQKLKLEEELKKVSMYSNSKEDVGMILQQNSLLKQQLDKLEREKQTLSQDNTKCTNTNTGTSSNTVRSLPVLLFTYNRAEYLKRTLTKLHEYLPDEGFPIIVSQDGTDAQVAQVVSSYPKVMHIQRSVRPYPEKRSPSESDSYYHISAHYKFGLQHVFDKLQYDAVIILEDDMEISPDFFDYFQATLNLLFSDPTLFCVSAWNDNGQKNHVKDSDVLYRSNFFPGLGWMLTRKFWKEVGPKWPAAYWDDWLREPDQRKDRDCIRPEVSRTYTFGREGSSAGQFFDRYLAPIQLNSEQINWKSKNLDYLMKSRYDQEFDKITDDAIVISSASDVQRYKDSTLIVYYTDEPSFAALAEQFSVMPDWKAGVPRTAYKGVVTFYQNSNRIVLMRRK